MNSVSILAIATIMTLPVVAKAQPVAGLYVGGGAGMNVIQDEDASLSTRRGTASWIFPPEVGPAVDLALGYGLGNGLRAEIEGAYRYNSMGGPGIGGQEQKFGPMVNLIYEIVGLFPSVQPYAGVGAGWQWAKDSNLRASSGRLVASDSTATRGNFTYQGILGTAIPIAAVPGLALTADYRILVVPGSRDYDADVTGLPSVLPGNLRLSNDFNHTIMVGFRYAFGAAVPPSPMAPSRLSRQRSFPDPISCSSTGTGPN